MSNANAKKKKRRKILFVITKSGWGGAGVYLYNIATSLAVSKFDVSVALGGDGLLKKKLEEKGIRTITIGKLGRNINILNDFAVFFELVKIFWEEKPDIVHLNSSKIGGLGALAGRLTGVEKVIFTVHGWAFNESRPQWQLGIIWFMSWLTMLLSHVTISVSKKDHSQATEMPFSKDKVIYIHNGIKPRRQMSKGAAREILLGERLRSYKQTGGGRKRNNNKNGRKIPIAVDALWVGMIAELTKNKGLKYAIEGIHRLVLDEKLPRQIILVIVGDGEDKYVLANLVKNLGLEDNVFLVGFKEDASRLLSAFDVLLFTSIKEGLPYALLEYGAAGLPVVTTGVGGIPEIITDLKTGLIMRPREVNEVKNALHFALTNPEKMREFGVGLKRDISERFSFAVMLKETMEVYGG